MASNALPIFPASYKEVGVSISTAESSRTAPTNYGTLASGGASGSVVTGVRVKATGTTTAGLVRIFFYDGTNYFLVGEVAIAAVVASGTVATFEGGWTPPDGWTPLASGHSLRVSTVNAEGFHVTAAVGDY